MDRAIESTMNMADEDEKTNLIIRAYERAAAAESRMTGEPSTPWEYLPKEKQAFYVANAVFVWTLLKKL